MKAISKKKKEEVEAKSYNAYFMSLFKDKDVKKTRPLLLSKLAQQEDQWCLSTANSHHVTRTAWLSAGNQL
eukprot:9920824-Ditylum_brightwellii.AAC.1